MFYYFWLRMFLLFGKGINNRDKGLFWVYIFNFEGMGLNLLFLFLFLDYVRFEVKIYDLRE